MRLAVLSLAVALPACSTLVSPPERLEGSAQSARVDLTADPLVPGSTVSLTVEGTTPDAWVRVAQSTNGLGAGPCFGGVCLDLVAPITLLASGRANGAGVAVLEVTVSEGLTVGTRIALQAVAEDLAGQRVASAPTEVTVEDAPMTVASLGVGDLVISELMLDPVQVGDAHGEWIEVRNDSGLDANLDGLQVSDGTTAVTVQGSTFLAAGDHLVIGVDATRATNGGLAVDRELSSLSLPNRQGEVALLADGAVIDAVAWDEVSGLPLYPGHSLARSDAGGWCRADRIYGLGDHGTPGKTNDCEPQVVPLGEAHTRLMAEPDPDYAGYSVADAGDVNGDGIPDVIVGAPDLSTSVGVAYLFLGPVGTGELELADADARFLGETPSTAAGISVASAGDMNGDGFDDLVIGAPYQDQGNGPGAAYVVYGPITGDVDLATADARLIGERDFDYAGYSVAGVGDVNGDGFDDVLVGAFGHDGPGSNRGAAYLVHGPVAGDVALATADARLFGEADADHAGVSVAGAGDVDGDGFDDLLVGAELNDQGGSNAGAAYLVLGPVTGDVELAAADARFIGELAGDWAGRGIAGAGDTDGDGNDDILIGAPYARGGVGAAYLFRGPLVGEVDLAAADAVVVGAGGGDLAGIDVAGAGDVNGDGLTDLLIGAAYHDTDAADAGAAYVVYAPIPASVSLYDADVILLGEGEGDAAGTSVAAAGDVDGDGFDDVWVGAPEHVEVVQGTFHRGAAYLVRGGDLR